MIINHSMLFTFFSTKLKAEMLAVAVAVMQLNELAPYQLGSHP